MSKKYSLKHESVISILNSKNKSVNEILNLKNKSVNAVLNLKRKSAIAILLLFFIIAVFLYEFNINENRNKNNSSESKKKLNINRNLNLNNTKEKQASKQESGAAEQESTDKELALQQEGRAAEKESTDKELALQQEGRAIEDAVLQKNTFSKNETSENKDAFSKKQTSDDAFGKLTEDSEKPFTHSSFSLLMDKGRQQVNILEVNTYCDTVYMKPMLAHKSGYGFKLLSGISELYNAAAIVNSGFYSIYGIPSGMFVSDGKVYKRPSGKYPVFFYDRRKEPGKRAGFILPDASESFYNSLKKNSDINAYECNVMILLNGKNVAPSYDRLIGRLDNYDPRTAIGINNNRNVILITVDGRQPGYSKGITVKTLAFMLAKMKVLDAALLDGGASTEMIVRGNIVNKPSFKGREIPLAGGLGVVEDGDIH